MLEGLKVKKEKGFTNLTASHVLISKMALDTGAIRVFDDFNINMDSQVRRYFLNLGFSSFEIPRRVLDTNISTYRDLLLLSHIPDAIDNDVVKRRIYHANLCDYNYHMFRSAIGYYSPFFFSHDHNFEEFIMFIAYLNHYYQDAAAPMHISLKDQDIHIKFEKDFAEYFEKEYDNLLTEVINIMKKRAQYDVTAMGSHVRFASYMPCRYSDIRDNLIKSYREKNEFEGIEVFLYIAVMSTVLNTTYMVVNFEKIWREYK